MEPMAETGKHVLFVDAYDSFSGNIAALLHQLLAARVTMIRIDSDVPRMLGESTIPDHDQFSHFFNRFDAIVVGPGPGNPENDSDIGIISNIWDAAAHFSIPVLGICLGFQSLCLAFGASISRLPQPCHGHAKEILHRNQDIFEHVGHIVATNYHSLEIKLGNLQSSCHISRSSSAGSFLSDSSTDSRSSRDSISSCHTESSQPIIQRLDLKPLAWDAQGTLMAVRHVSLPFWGLQFHPESCKSNPACHNVVQNWWKAATNWSLSARPHFVRSLYATQSLMHSVSTSVDVAETLLPAELRRLTNSSGQYVQKYMLKLRTDSQNISDLCYKLSSSLATVMLESTKRGRYSIYALRSPSMWRLESQRGENHCVIHDIVNENGLVKLETSDVFETLHHIVSCKKARGGDPDSPFWGGFLGYFSYEMGLKTLNLAGHNDIAGRRTPDVNLLWVERSIVVDNLDGTVHIQSIRENDMEWIASMTNRMSNLPRNHPRPDTDTDTLNTLLASARISLPDEAAYKSSIITCQSQLLAGDSYELCLTAEAQIVIQSSSPSSSQDNPRSQPNPTSWLLYRNLRTHNPVPFSAYLRLGNTTILSSSPEQFLTWDRAGTIDMAPMKGTVKKTPDMDFAKASQILASPKESAENLMIADLIRHDLYSSVGWGAPATVEVVKLCEVVEFETVWQSVSHIRARAPISKNLSLHETQREVIKFGHTALKHTMPPGSMTGAPKKRSCEILADVEKRERGVYSGVIGYLDVGGGGGWSVAIRTAFSVDDRREGGSQPQPQSQTQTWRVGAGGAITVLSDVDAEWEEMKTKLDSVLRAFQPRKPSEGK